MIQMEISIQTRAVLPMPHDIEAGSLAPAAEFDVPSWRYSPLDRPFSPQAPLAALVMSVRMTRICIPFQIRYSRVRSYLGDQGAHHKVCLYF